jgi:hypothetical protein
MKAKTEKNLENDRIKQGLYLAFRVILQIVFFFACLTLAYYVATKL